MRRIPPLTSLVGIYVPSPGKVAHGELPLRGRNTIVRACTSTDATSFESSAPAGLTGKLANAYIATYREH